MRYNLKVEIGKRSKNMDDLLSQEKFERDHIICEVGDLDDYQVNGLLMAYLKKYNMVGIASFNHCSCYSTVCAMEGGDTWNEINWKYLGSPKKLYRLIMDDRDYTFIHRKISPDDKDYFDQTELRKFYKSWYEDGKPIDLTYKIDIHNGNIDKRSYRI